MEKSSNNYEEKNNTGLTITIIVIIISLIGLIAYFVMGNNNVEDAIDDAKDTTENIIENNNTNKTMSDVIGSYQAKIAASEGIDEDTSADEDNYIELVLKEDGTSNLVMTKDNKNTIIGNYTVSDNTVTISTDNITYQFTINEDNTLNYLDGTNEVTLSKIENSDLKYIK